MSATSLFVSLGIRRKSHLNKTSRRSIKHSVTMKRLWKEGAYSRKELVLRTQERAIERDRLEPIRFCLVCGKKLEWRKKQDKFCSRKHFDIGNSGSNNSSKRQEVRVKISNSRIGIKMPCKNTSIEIMLQEASIHSELSFLTNYKVIGRPDIVYPDLGKIAVFADGCYTHGCPIHRPFEYNLYGRKPIEEVRLRDKFVTQKLSEEGWKVFRFWEHEINESAKACIEKVLNSLKKSEIHLVI